MIKQKQQIQGNIASLCENEPAITAAFIFGSYAKGRENPSSDLDVAILLNEKEIEKFSLLGFISRLNKQLGGRVDGVILNNAGEVLKFEIRRDGLLIFERSSQQRKNFEVKSRKSYEDFLYLYEKADDAIVFDNFKNNLSDFDLFVDRIVHFLGKTS